MKSFLGFIVVIEAYRFKGVKQCYNCLHLNHSSELCTLDPKYLKCAENHRTNLCPKTANEKCICANCGEEYPANYKGCPRHPFEIKAKNKGLKIIQDRGKKITENNVILNPSNTTTNKNSYTQVAKRNLGNNSNDTLIASNAIINDNIMHVNSNTGNMINDNYTSTVENLKETVMPTNVNENINNDDNTNVNMNVNNTSSNEPVNANSTIEQLIYLEKILTNIVNLCKTLDNSQSAKALGIQKLLSAQVGSMCKNIPH